MKKAKFIKLEWKELEFNGYYISNYGTVKGPNGLIKNDRTKSQLLTYCDIIVNGKKQRIIIHNELTKMFRPENIAVSIYELKGIYSRDFKNKDKSFYEEQLIKEYKKGEITHSELLYNIGLYRTYKDDKGSLIESIARYNKTDSSKLY